eukprot:2840753-Rhodomonas_salina.2
MPLSLNQLEIASLNGHHALPPLQLYRIPPSALVKVLTPTPHKRQHCIHKWQRYQHKRRRADLRGATKSVELHLGLQRDDADGLVQERGDGRGVRAHHVRGQGAHGAEVDHLCQGRNALVVGPHARVFRALVFLVHGHALGVKLRANRRVGTVKELLHCSETRVVMAVLPLEG